MEQSFWGKLRRVKIKDLLHIFLFLIALPVSFLVKKRRPGMWLLCDTENEARDNAYWLFRYIRTQHKEQDVVYAINKKSPDYDRVKDLGEVIAYGSLKHWIYYLAAEINISSQKMGKPNAAICYVLEVYGILKNTRVFLQHGIITADLSFLYYPHTKMRMFVTSTYDEWKYVNDNYGYPEGYVQELGLCRLDSLHEGKVNPKQILFMPTWRMYIRNEISASDPAQESKQFMETEYYKNWEALLENHEFIAFLEKEDLQLVFYPHREMHRFLKYFHTEHPRIRIASWPEDDVQELLKESALLVTDFSSVAMDFAYMKKPLIYYQFDNEKFRESHHGQGYFDFARDGFGPVVVDAGQVVAEIMNLYDDEGKTGFNNQQKYLNRHSSYFDLWDTDNCKRNYEAIKALGKNKELQ